MEMPDVIYVEHSADEWVNGKYAPLYEGGTKWDGSKTEYHHSRVVEALRKENEELKAKLDKAKNALRFYADKESYITEFQKETDGSDFISTPIIIDYGKSARATLEELGE